MENLCFLIVDRTCTLCILCVVRLLLSHMYNFVKYICCHFILSKSRMGGIGSIAFQVLLVSQ